MLQLYLGEKLGVSGARIVRGEVSSNEKVSKGKIVKIQDSYVLGKILSYVSLLCLGKYAKIFLPRVETTWTGWVIQGLRDAWCLSQQWTAPSLLDPATVKHGVAQLLSF